MVFQGEDKVLSQDIIKRPKDFTKTWSEWAADTWEQIIKGVQGTTATDLVIFTVPKRNTLWITSAFISMHGTVADNRCNINVRGRAGFLGIAGGNGDTVSLSISFPMPIKIEEGEIVEHENNTNTLVIFRTGFTGFLVPKRIS